MSWGRRGIQASDVLIRFKSFSSLTVAKLSHGTTGDCSGVHASCLRSLAQFPPGNCQSHCFKRSFSIPVAFQGARGGFSRMSSVAQNRRGMGRGKEKICKWASVESGKPGVLLNPFIPPSSAQTPFAGGSWGTCHFPSLGSSNTDQLPSLFCPSVALALEWSCSEVEKKGKEGERKE